MKYNALSEKTAIKRRWRVGASWYLEAPRRVADGGMEASWINFPERLELTCIATNPHSAAFSFAKKFLGEYGFYGVKVRSMYHHSKMFSIESASGARCDVEVTEEND